MSEKKLTMQPVGENAPEVFKKMAVFLGGSRTTANQVGLVMGGVTILVDVLKQIIGDDATKVFLNDVLSSVESGKRPVCAAEIVVKH